jgi:uncharacterized protein
VKGELFYHVHVKGGPAGCDLSPNINTLRIEESGGKSNQLTVQVSDPHKVISHAVQEGMNIEVDLGTTDDHSLVFRGMIYKTEGDFPEEGTPTVILKAYDQSMSMGLKRRNRIYTDVTLTDIIKQVAKGYFSPEKTKVTLRGEPTFTGNGIRQQNETDLAFLLRLAQMFGCELVVTTEEDSDALLFIAQHAIMKKKPEVTLHHGRCGAPHRLLRFRADSDISNIQLPRVMTGIDADTGERLEVETAGIAETQTSSDAFRDENVSAFMCKETEKTTRIRNLVDAAEPAQKAIREMLGTVRMEPTPSYTTQEALRIRTQNQFSTSLHGMRGTGATAGNHRIQAQTTIELADLGGRFSNIWYLFEVRHILDRNGYITEFECQR